MGVDAILGLNRFLDEVRDATVQVVPLEGDGAGQNGGSAR